MKHAKWLLGAFVVVAVFLLIAFTSHFISSAPEDVYYVEGESNVLVKVNEKQYKEVTQDGISVNSIMERDGLVPQS